MVDANNPPLPFLQYQQGFTQRPEFQDHLRRSRSKYTSNVQTTSFDKIKNSTSDLYNCEISLPELLSHKKKASPQPKYIRNTLDVQDINNGAGIGEGKDPSHHISYIGTKAILGKAEAPIRRRQFGLAAALHSSQELGSSVVGADLGQSSQYAPKGSLYNKDIHGSTVDPKKYARAPRQYSTLDYSDVTHGSAEGRLDVRHLPGLSVSKPALGQGCMRLGKGALATLKPEQYLPHQLLCKVRHDQDHLQRVADQYKNQYQRRLDQDH